MFGGLVTQKYGGKQSLLWTMITKSILVILTPALATLGWQYMVAKQVLEGFIGGLVFPCIHDILSKWIHPLERGLLAPLALTGSTAGTIIMIVSSGYIATSNLGWPSTFYIPGVCGIIWSIVWLIIGANSPVDCRTMSKEEAAFLQTIPGIAEVKPSTPWLQIFTSKPVWALIISQFGESWVFVMLQRSVPMYIDSILKIDVESVTTNEYLCTRINNNL